MTKYFEFFKIDFIESLRHRGTALGRVAFYAIILFVFSRLWQVTSQTEDIGQSPKMMVWYLGLTEILVLCYPLLHIEIDEDVRSGNLAYSLLRPASYFWSRFFRGLGAVCARIILLITFGGVFVIAFSGGLPDKPASLLLFIPMALASVIVGLIFQIMIGITSFWVQDSSPLYWVWQKMCFILGGMILPFEIYPDWLKNLAMYLPFPYLIYVPVRAVLDGNLAMAVYCLEWLSLWFIVALVLSFILFRSARRSLVLNGG